MSKHGPYDFFEIIGETGPASWNSPIFMLDALSGQTVEAICRRVYNEARRAIPGVFLDNYRGQGLHREMGCDEH